jgi:hypothetical protein
VRDQKIRVRFGVGPYHQRRRDPIVGDKARDRKALLGQIQVAQITSVERRLVPPMWDYSLLDSEDSYCTIWKASSAVRRVMGSVVLGLVRLART